MNLNKETLKSEFLRRVDVYKLFFSKPKEAMSYIGQSEKLDTYQMLFTLVVLAFGVLITGQGIFGVIGSVIGTTISFFVVGAILLLLGLIGNAQMSYIKIVNLVIYTFIIPAAATTFSLVTIVGGLIGIAASIYAFVLQVIGLIEIGNAEPKRMYIAIGIFVGIFVLIGIIITILIFTTSLFTGLNFLRELNYYF